MQEILSQNVFMEIVAKLVNELSHWGQQRKLLIQKVLEIFRGTNIFYKNNWNTVVEDAKKSIGSMNKLSNINVHVILQAWFFCELGLR